MNGWMKWVYLCLLWVNGECRFAPLMTALFHSLSWWWFLTSLYPTAGLCYAELGTVIPKSGGEYSYLLDTLGPIPAFLFSWISTMVLKPSDISAVTLTFGAYASQALFNTDGGDCDPPMVTTKLFAACAIGEYRQKPTPNFLTSALLCQLRTVS